MSQQHDQLRSFEQIAEARRIFLAAEHALSKISSAVLLISSAHQGEGKSLASAILAATAARLRKQPTLVMDFNWYKPSLHEYFAVDRNGQLEDYRKSDLQELVQPTDHEQVDLLTAPLGANNRPPQLDNTDSNLAHRLIQQASETYPLTIIDTASVFPTNRLMMDPIMLAKMVDGVALVVQSATTPRQIVKKSQKIMETAGGNLIGVITNQRRPD